MIAEPDMMTLIRMDKLIQEVKIKSKFDAITNAVY